MSLDVANFAAGCHFLNGDKIHENFGIECDFKKCVVPRQAVDTYSDMGLTQTNSTLTASPEWVGQWGSTDRAGVAQIFGGVNFQSAHWVHGAEARSSFGSFGASADQEHAFATTKTGSFSDYEGAAVTFTNHGDVLSGEGLAPVMENWRGLSYSMPLTQTGRLASQVK